MPARKLLLLVAVVLLAACGRATQMPDGTPDVVVILTAAPSRNPAVALATHQAAVRGTWTAIARTPLPADLAPGAQTATITAREAAARITEVVWMMLASNTPTPTPSRTATPTPIPGGRRRRKSDLAPRIAIRIQGVPQGAKSDFRAGRAAARSSHQLLRIWTLTALPFRCTLRSEG